MGYKILSFGKTLEQSKAISKGKNPFTLKQLDEHIDFKPAETVSEGIEFGKKAFGITYSGFKKDDLEALNWVNEALVNVSNALKGNVRLPDRISYSNVDIGKNCVAHVAQGGPNHGRLTINKKFFYNELDKHINARITVLEEEGWRFDLDSGITYYKGLPEEQMKAFSDKVSRYKRGELSSLKEKIQLYSENEFIENELEYFETYIFKTIKYLLKEPKAKNILNAKGIETDLNKIEKLSIEKQCEYFDKICPVLAEKIDIRYSIEHVVPSPFFLLYHELGHINDPMARCDETHAYRGSKNYPEQLKKWQNNKAIQETAYSISSYAATAPQEFVVEIFAGIIDGAKYSHEVMNLYKKLKGPKFPQN